MGATALTAVLVLLGWAWPDASVAGVCNPAVSCCAPPTPGTPQCPVGNPIDVMTGNKYQQEHDMPPLPGVLGLELVRHYNSGAALNDERGLLGRGWRLGYEEELVLGRAAQGITLILADGSRRFYGRSLLQPEAGHTVFSAPQAGLAPLRSERTRWGLEYSVRLDRNLHVFDEQGRLSRIEAPTGEVLTLERDARGRLHRVVDPQGRALVLHHAAAARDSLQPRWLGVQAIDTPVGRFQYTHGHPPAPGSRATPLQLVANLVRVAMPAATGRAASARLYHYEDAVHPWSLTGISVQGQGSEGQDVNQRIASWRYDAQGRANLSVRGAYDPSRPGLEQLTLDFSAAGADGGAETLLTNSQGQRTRYRYARVLGETRLLEVRGAGCASCGGVNLRYGYDFRGRLSETTQLDPQGRPLHITHTMYDGADRVLRVDEQRVVQGRPGPVRLQVRYAYGGDAHDPLPRLIAQPSVVPGREHTWRLQYNGQGQPTEVVETGFSPVDAGGSPSAAGQELTRTTRLIYASINRRSVLVAIDGPLANGPTNSPEDSDVTRFEWDDTGSFVRAVIAPLAQRTRLGMDAAGRVARLTLDDGTVLNLAYQHGGELLSIDRQMGELPLGRTVFQYDPLRRLTGEVQSLGGEELAHRRQMHDTAGHLLWQADAPGLFRQAHYDSEGRLTAVRVSAGPMRQEERYAYDAGGRLERVEDSTGAVRRLVWDAAGRLVASVDPLGRWTGFEPGDATLAVTHAMNTAMPLAAAYRFDRLGQLSEARLQGEDGSGRKRLLTHRRVVDDFGRELVVEGPDAGRQVRVFDAADRLVRVVLADGAPVDFAYDAGGRLVRRALQASASPAQAEVVTYSYAGRRLVRIEDPQQVESFAYDEQGRLQSRTVSLKLNAGGTVQTQTRYRYDARGRLAGQTLPDGSELQFERDGQGQVVALHRQALPWSPWDWSRSTLARGLERDLVKVARLTYGNGIEAHWERSASGLLARVVYRQPPPPDAGVRTAVEALLPAAHAQASGAAAATAAAAALPAAPASAAPMAGPSADPRALWDARYLFDAGGNLLVQAQRATSPAARPSHTLLAYDVQDQLAQAVLRRPGADGAVLAAPDAVWRYHSDSLGNRLLAQEGQPAASDTQVLAYEAASNRRAGTASDAAGRPGRSDGRTLQWDSLGRLQSVTWHGASTRYRYNREGLRVASDGAVQRHHLYDEARHRLADLDGEGRLVRQYVWLGDQLLAVLDDERPCPPAGGWGSRWLDAWRLAWTAWKGSIDLKYVHPDHRGAPVAMTDAKARTVWHAEYAPFGQRMGASDRPRTSLDLRGPGQWEDAESGLYYNDQRYYDPQAGRYLSPDPLGLDGGMNGFSYAGNNPLVYGDPSGLVLLAFDGTGNTRDTSWLRSHGSSLSNVVQFQELYDSGSTWYVSGVGTVHIDQKYGDIRPADYAKGTLLNAFPGVGPEGADMGGNYSGPARIERMMQYFNDESDLVADDIAMPVDIVGFSRGAAEARDFANRIVGLTRNGYYRYTRLSDHTVHCQKLSFRFMGLFDTVLSTNRSGTGYNLGIPDAFTYVAQAVAMNEYRGNQTHGPHDSYGSFPLESIRASATSAGTLPGTVRTELGFLGSHADIGGGFGENENQLSLVALVWMVNQARKAGITMRDVKLSLPPNPVLHDKSDSGIYGQGAPSASSEDRSFRYQNGSRTTQRRMVPLSGMSYADTLDFIHFFRRGLKWPDWPMQSSLYQTGTVDVERYLQWLDCHGYHIRQDASKCPATM